MMMGVFRSSYFTFVWLLLSCSYSGVVVAKLPFEPVSIFRGIFHSGLKKSTDPRDCCMVVFVVAFWVDGPLYSVQHDFPSDGTLYALNSHCCRLRWSWELVARVLWTVLLKWWKMLRKRLTNITKRINSFTWKRRRRRRRYGWILTSFLVYWRTWVCMWGFIEKGCPQIVRREEWFAFTGRVEWITVTGRVEWIDSKKQMLVIPKMIWWMACNGILNRPTGNTPQQSP